MRPTRRAFTLIELLVVITIIVVLLTLLLPGLDRAMYQAQLVSCSGNLHSIAKGAIGYAMGNRQLWPHRTAIHGRPTIGGGLTADNNWEAWTQNEATYKLRRVNTLKEDGNDDRPLLGQYIDLKAFLDPLCGSDEVDLQPKSDDPQFVMSDYTILFGMAYLEKWQNSWQRKLGNPMNAGDHNFIALIGDFSLTLRTDPSFATMSSHPDKDGRATLFIRNRQGDYIDTKWTTPIGTIEPGDRTVSAYKGYIDFNQAFWDGSVQRYSDVRWDEWKWDPSDIYPHYFTSLPWQADGNWSRGEYQMKNENGHHKSIGVNGAQLDVDHGL